ncbi:MAG: Threonine--tRNA ligase 2 [Synergistetes bacterium ADurb.BinA166]|nr:MAG: Threonine--tRNA ligase 2 [Synergistetes bacterium ADurb.BinA166]
MLKFVGGNGKIAEVQAGTKAVDVLEALGLKKGAVAAAVDGRGVDLSRPLEEGGRVEPILAGSDEGLDILRHSAAHLMAQAVEQLYPGTRYGVGPSIKDGFYYDMEIPGGITEEDLPKIEREMSRLAKRAIPVERRVMSREQALDWFRKKDDPYKMEIISDLEEDTVTLYAQGDYADLCRGPHVPDTSFVRHFKLLSVAGAYWRGDEKNIMLTRVYGTAFADEESLAAYLHRMEEAKNRDHRRLGKELDLFSIQPEGPGFPFFHPKGMVVLNSLIDFWRKEHTKRGYCEIRTPLILERSLWIQSGHWDHYRDNMYFTEIDERPFAIKPMNCPGGMLVYKSQIRSYRDLPLRMAELGVVHRHERSGVLHGLMRVRCFTQDDAHLYCAPEQVKDEIIGIMDLCNYIYKEVFGFKYSVELSTRPENSMGSKEQWDAAEDALKSALHESGVEYKLNPGDGAFYGPKIDFHLEDCIGRTWQCGTIQLDFQMPEKFDLNFIGADGREHRPVMLHRTVLGSLERFFGILIENFAGAFPYWIAPVQARVLPVSAEFAEYAGEVAWTLKSWGVRTEVDERDEKLGKKIRDAQTQKIPYMIVIGEKERESGAVAPRERTRGDLGSMSLEQFREVLSGEFDPMRK